METITTPVRRNKAARVSLIAGILSIICYWSRSIITLILWIMAEYTVPDIDNSLRQVIYYFVLVFNGIPPITAITAGIVSLGQIKKSQEMGKGYAITGIVLGCLILIPVLLILYQATIRILMNS